MHELIDRSYPHEGKIYIVGQNRRMRLKYNAVKALRKKGYIQIVCMMIYKYDRYFRQQEILKFSIF